MKWLLPAEVAFAPVSVIDDAGRVFFYEGRVFRAISSKKHADIYRDVLGREWIDEVFDQGLVRTKVSEEIALQGAFLTVEHEAIPFETHPAEHTSAMHWLAAKTVVAVSRSLASRGYVLKDAHPWNVMFQRGCPKVVDFGSIVTGTEVPDGWLQEFERYFCIPIWLAARGWHGYAREYRRQHGHGFGMMLLQEKLVSRVVFRGLRKISRFSSSPSVFFQRLDAWLEKHTPSSSGKEEWAEYRQCGDSVDALAPVFPKQKFVLDVLRAEAPAKVLDLAANKGYYSEMAARLGAAVVACDLEEYCVDQCLNVAQQKDLAITPAVLDVARPTPPYGLGLYGRDSYQRFRSPIVLALGLVHHICIGQGIPVEVFCDICMRYADKGVVLEYVAPTDKHVASWGRPVPPGYSLEEMVAFFARKFPRVARRLAITEDGVDRILIYLTT